MSRRCASLSCCNHENPASDISYFRFPKQPDRFKKWVLNCDRRDLLDKDINKVNRNTHLCARHFTDDMCPSTLKNSLNPNAVPTIFGEQNLLSEMIVNVEEPFLQNTAEERLIADYSNKEIEWKINLSHSSQSIDEKPVENASQIIIPYQVPAISKNLNILTGFSTISKVARKSELINLKPKGKGVIVGTQTPGYFNTNTPTTRKLRLKIKQLNTKVRMLQSQLDAAKNSKMAEEEAMEVLRPKLSDAGFLFLKTMLRKSNFESYSDEEKAFFLKLFCQGRKSYDFLNKHCISIPHHKTLQRWMKQAADKQNVRSDNDNNQQHMLDAINTAVAEEHNEPDDGIFEIQIDESLLSAF